MAIQSHLTHTFATKMFLAPLNRVYIAVVIHAELSDHHIRSETTIIASTTRQVTPEHKEMLASENTMQK